MKKQEIAVGGIYAAKVSGRIVPVKVLAIREVSKFKRNNYSGESVYADATVYDVENQVTKRRTTFRSAAKFRHAVKSEPVVLVHGNTEHGQEITWNGD